MAIGLGGPVGGSDKDEIGLDRALFSKEAMALEGPSAPHPHGSSPASQQFV
jgi:hypothetical protein